MNIEITKQERNELLEREDIELDINHAGEATPSENDVRKQLAAELDLDPTTVRIDHIYSSNGRGFSTGVVTVFDEPIMDELPEDSEESAEEATEEASTEEEVEEDSEEETADDEEDASEDEDESEPEEAEESDEEDADEETEDEEEEDEA